MPPCEDSCQAGSPEVPWNVPSPYLLQWEKRSLVTQEYKAVVVEKGKRNGCVEAGGSSFLPEEKVGDCPQAEDYLPLRIRWRQRDTSPLFTLGKLKARFKCWSSRVFYPLLSCPPPCHMLDIICDPLGISQLFVLPGPFTGEHSL